MIRNTLTTQWRYRWQQKPRSPATDTLDERQLLTVLHGGQKGDFSVRMPVDQSGVAGKVADTLNQVIEFNGA